MGCGLAPTNRPRVEVGWKDTFLQEECILVFCWVGCGRGGLLFPKGSPQAAHTPFPQYAEGFLTTAGIKPEHNTEHVFSHTNTHFLTDVVGVSPASRENAHVQTRTRQEQ